MRETRREEHTVRLCEYVFTLTTIMKLAANGISSSGYQELFAALLGN